MSKLDQVNEFQENYRIDKEQKPLFHVTAPIGWLNDPNGFSEYNGKKHLFYQYHPYSSTWGPMHWGHTQTDDFVVWEDLPVALAPDTEYDWFGCYSGSAVETEDGKHALIYTGVVLEDNDNGTKDEVQKQCIAFGDGLVYEKFEGNPIIEGKDLPKDFSKYHFRDPKVWKEDDSYYMVVGNLDGEDNGQVLLFESKDLKDWKYLSVLSDSKKGKYGKMWECPDFFQLDSQYVLLVSPQDMLADGKEFYNGNHAITLIGEYDKENHKLIDHQIEMTDYGTEFYAPQTLLTEDGRRVMIAWLASWDMIDAKPFDSRKWNGMMTLPRELELRNGKLFQRPIREIENYWKDSFEIDDFNLDGEISFPEISGRAIDLKVTVKGEDYSKFILRFGKNDQFQTTLTYNREKNEVKFDRTFSGIRRDFVSEREFAVKEPKDEFSIRIILDKYSVEAFINDGRQTLSATMFTPLEADQISFETVGEATINIESHKIEVK